MENSDPPCVCCAYVSWARHGRVAGYPLLRCRNCGFVTALLPDDLDLANLYGEDYFYGRGFDKSLLIPESREPLPALVARRRYFLTLITEFLGGPGQLLDVGCGAGALLDVAQDMGWTAEGQEIGVSGAEEARSRGHRVHVGELSTLALPNESIDAATMIEVIEHLDDPQPELDRIAKLLRRPGCLLLTTGDIGTTASRALGVKWEYLRPPGHVSYFTRKALTLLLLRSGFSRIWFAPTFDIAFPSVFRSGENAPGWARPVAKVLRSITRRDLIALATV